jgi:hypothetical protein
MSNKLPLGLGQLWQAGCVDSVTVGATGETGLLETRLRRMLAPQMRTLRPWVVVATSVLLVAGVAISTPQVAARPQATVPPKAQSQTTSLSPEQATELEQRVIAEMRGWRVRYLKYAGEARAQWEQTLAKAMQEREALRNKSDKTDADKNRLVKLEIKIVEAKRRVEKFKQQETYADESAKAYSPHAELAKAAVDLDMAQFRVGQIQSFRYGYHLYLRSLEQEDRTDPEAPVCLVIINEQLKEAQQAVVDKRKAYRAVQAQQKQSKKG